MLGSSGVLLFMAASLVLWKVLCIGIKRGSRGSARVIVEAVCCPGCMWSDQASRTGVLGCCHAWTYIVLYILAVALWALFRMTMPTYRCLFNNLFGCLIILIWVFWVV